MDSRTSLTTKLRIASWSLTGAGLAVILILGGSAAGHRESARWMQVGSVLILGGIVLSAINLFVSRRRP